MAIAAAELFFRKSRRFIQHLSLCDQFLHALVLLVLLDRLTHHVHVLKMNGDSSRPKRSRSWMNNDGDSSLRNIEFVEANAHGRNLHGLRKSILHSLNDFDGGLFARFIG